MDRTAKNVTPSHPLMEGFRSAILWGRLPCAFWGENRIVPIRVDATTGPLISALIGAGFGIAGAIYAGITSSRNSKRLAKLQAELDRHKQMILEYLKAYMTLEIDERNRSLEAFKAIITSVQLFRDKLRRFLEAPHAYAVERLARELTEMWNVISEAYATNQLFISQDADRVLAHALKNHCLSVVNLLHSHVGQPAGTLLEKLAVLQDSIANEQAELRRRARLAAELFMRELKANLEAEPNASDGK